MRLYTTIFTVQNPDGDNTGIFPEHWRTSVLKFVSFWPKHTETRRSRKDCLHYMYPEKHFIEVRRSICKAEINWSTSRFRHRLSCYNLQYCKDLLHPTQFSWENSWFSSPERRLLATYISSSISTQWRLGRTHTWSISVFSYYLSIEIFIYRYWESIIHRSSVK